MSRMHVFVGAVAALGVALSTSSAAAQPRLPTAPTTAPAGSPTAPAGAAPLGGAVSVEDQVVKLIADRDVCRATACGGPKATATCTPVAACDTAFRAAVTAIGKWPSHVRIAPRRAVAGQEVTISGTGFQIGRRPVTVIFSGATEAGARPVTVMPTSDDVLKLKIPPDAMSGAFVVETLAGRVQVGNYDLRSRMDLGDDDQELTIEYPPITPPITLTGWDTSEGPAPCADRIRASNLRATDFVVRRLASGVVDPIGTATSEPRWRDADSFRWRSDATAVRVYRDVDGRRTASGWIPQPVKPQSPPRVVRVVAVDYASGEATVSDTASPGGSVFLELAEPLVPCDRAPTAVSVRYPDAPGARSADWSFSAASTPPASLTSGGAQLSGPFAGFAVHPAAPFTPPPRQKTDDPGKAIERASTQTIAGPPTVTRDTRWLSVRLPANVSIADATGVVRPLARIEVTITSRLGTGSVIIPISARR